jgi:hypothetical protein
MNRMALVVVLILSANAAQAQSFSSGSTGADGALALIQGEVRVIQVPESGVFNFTTVSIAPAEPGNLGRPTILGFIPNQRNTPVTILAQGNVFIAGQIFLSASGQTPGPGGFYGGNGGQAGFGPGGGAAATAGTWIGPLSLVPPVGGSGGGGGCVDAVNAPGGGGGGAIVIASSTLINVSGQIIADGAPGSGGRCTSTPPGGPGSGGAIRLVANAITVSGRLEATGPSGADGVIRVEAPVAGLAFTGSSSPSAVLAPINPNVLPTATTAALTISSIGGFPVFSDAGVRPGSVDVVLPRGLSDPISLVVQGRNIPVGTQVSLNPSGSAGATYAPGTLIGSLELSSATLQVSGLDRNAETHLFVFATFDVPQSAAVLNPNGPDQVARIRIQAAPGKPSTIAFLRRDGSVIDPKKIPSALLQHLGYLKN